MKWFCYNLLFALAYAVMLPSFLLRMRRRGGYRARMGDRFARYPAAINTCLRDGGRIWVHAVSVGEVQVAVQLMRAMRVVDPRVRFVFSTTSSTGWKTAEKLLTPEDVLIYNPLDFPSLVKRALSLVRPRAIILTETEIWPNFIRYAHRLGVPLYLVNARVSDRSAPRYKALRVFFGEVLRMFSKIYAQSELDRTRLLAAGAEAQKVVTTGSFKFDVAKRNRAKEKELRDWIGAGSILLGGSTWPGEDEVLLRICQKVLENHPDVKLVLAPRHFEKADAVEANIKAAGFACVRRSRGDENASVADARARAVYLCDTTGELMGLFGIADVSFVGKSLCAHGSQNMIEPCLCANATVVGPYTENFRPVMSDLLEANALVQVSDEETAMKAILDFFDSKESRQAFGARAELAVARRRGVTARCAEELVEAIRAVPVPAAFARSRMGMICASAIVCWLISTCFVTQPIRHAWNVMRLDPNRSYAGFWALSTVTALYPWTWKDARKALKGMCALEPLGRDEFGVERFTATSRLAVVLPVLFPGHAVRNFDARFQSMCKMKRVAEECKKQWGGYRLWAIGRWNYVFMAPAPAGKTNRKVRADALMAEFSAAFDHFAAAGVYAPAQVFACYMGDEREIDGAFANVTFLDYALVHLPYRLLFSPAPTGGRAQVRTSYLAQENAPDMSWLTRGSLSARVWFDFTEYIVTVQRARRRALSAFDCADRGGAFATNAIPDWAFAAEVNPCDPLMRNLADVLDVQGRQFLAIGNVNGALRCYENRLSVFPRDYAAIHNFGMCLKQAGYMDKAAHVFSEAARRDPTHEEHLLEFITCAAAAGQEEAALKVLENLIAKHPDDARLKIRAAKIRSFLYKRNIDTYLK